MGGRALAGGLCAQIRFGLRPRNRGYLSPDERFAGLLGWASWLGLWLALVAAVTALFSQWAVDGLGTRDMGVALSFAFLARLVGIGTLYAAPALAGLLALFYQRAAGLRLLAAGAICGIPLALLTLLEHPG